MSAPARAKRGLTPFLLLVLCLGGASGQVLVDDGAGSRGDRVEVVLEQASNAMAGVYDYRGALVKRERFGEELVEQTIEFKFSRPFRVYVKYLEPYAGREGIYVRGANRNRLRAHKGSVPDVAVSLNPRGQVAMLENHHPITSFGLEEMLEVGARNIRKALARDDATITIKDGGMVLGEETWRIDVRSEPGGRHVTARQSEDLWELAARVDQDMYVILHHNDDIDSPTELRAGQRVFVPNYYARRGQYFIGRRTFMMLKAVSWDQGGNLYESYEYTELELNPGLEDRDFDQRNKDYDFMLINQR